MSNSVESYATQHAPIIVSVGNVRMNAVTPLVVGVTSHRNIPAGEIPALRQRLRELFTRLQAEFPDLPLTVLSSLAEGGDQLVAEEGLNVGVRLIAPLPFARDLYARDFTDAATHARFETLYAQAQAIELPLLTGHTHAAVSAEGEQRSYQYAQAGTFIAWHCHLLIAIWDGKPSHRIGGTAQIVDYFLNGTPPGGTGSQRAPRPRLYGGGAERLMYHLVCSREQPDGQPAAPLQPGQAIWRGPDGVVIPDAPVPKEVRAVLAQAAEFNQDAAKYAGVIPASSASAAGADETKKVRINLSHRRKPVPRFLKRLDSVLTARDGRNTGFAGAKACRRNDGTQTIQSLPDATQPSVTLLFQTADRLANHFQKRVLLALRVLYSVAFLMGMAFAVYDNLSGRDDMLYVFLLLFAVGAIVTLLAKHRGWHRKYLDYRALAEGLRVQCYWLRAGIPLDGEFGSSRDSPMQKQEAELAWVRNVMRSSELSAASNSEQLGNAALHGVIEEWVGDANGGELGYYRVRTRQREHAHRVNQAIGAICLAAAICISIMMAVLAQRLSFEAKHGWIVVMAVFTIFAAVREAYSFRKADRELTRQYRFMERVFRNARAALDRAQGASQQRAILQALGEAALAEHVEWAVMHRQRPLEVKM